MSVYHQTIGVRRYVFDGLAQLLACASAERSGDLLAGLSARSAEERVAAQMALAQVPLAQFLQEVIVPYESDEITRLIIDSHEHQAFAPVAQLSVGGLRDWLLSDEVDSASLAELAPGLTPEMVAAVAKLMRNQDLIQVARKCRA